MIPKFRAWHKEQKKMYAVGTMGFVTEEVLLIPLEEDCYCGFEHVVVMQWTGLKDVNGQDIYAGDIVSVDLKDRPDKNIIVQIKWCPLKCSFIPDCEDPYYSDSMINVFHHDGIGVILGNIYETKELLNVT